MQEHRPEQALLLHEENACQILMKNSSSRRHLGRTGTQQHAARSPLPALCRPHPTLGSGRAAASHLHSADNAPVAARPPSALNLGPIAVQTGTFHQASPQGASIVTLRSGYRARTSCNPSPSPANPVPRLRCRHCCCTRAGWKQHKFVLEALISWRKQHSKSHSFLIPSGGAQLPHLGTFSQAFALH